MDGMKIDAATSDKVNELLRYVADAVKDGGDAIKEQAPMVAREIVAYGFWSGAVGCAIGIAAIFVAFAAGLLIHSHVKHAKANFKPYYKGNEFDPILDANSLIVIGGTMAVLVGVVFGSVEVVSSVYPIVKTTVAPRLYVLDYLRGK